MHVLYVCVSGGGGEGGGSNLFLFYHRLYNLSAAPMILKVL